MKTIKIYLMLLFVLFGLLACTPVTYDVFSSIVGTVVDVETMEPLSGVTVSLSPSSKDAPITKLDGYFEFLNLESDTQYTITVQKKDYSTNRKTIKTIAGETHNVTITMEKLK